MRAPPVPQVKPSFSCSIFIEGDYLGSFLSPPWLEYSLAYFCPQCGEIWARVVAPRKFIPLQVTCTQHQDEWSIPGSLLYGRYIDLLPTLPLAALQRELMVHINWTEKEQS